MSSGGMPCTMENNTIDLESTVVGATAGMRGRLLDSTFGKASLEGSTCFGVKVPQSTPTHDTRHGFARISSFVAKSSVRLDKALLKLQHLIAQVPQQRRREALESVPLNVRLALLRSMETARKRIGCADSFVPARCTRGSISVDGQNWSTDVDDDAAVKRRAGEAKGFQCPRAFAESYSSSMVGKLSAISMASFRATSVRVTHGVSHKSGGYMARARIAQHLEAATCCQASWERAALFYKVLVRARVLATSDHHQELNDTIGEDRRLKISIDMACKEFGLTSDELGLSFCALVDAHSLVGRTIAGSFGTDLDQALAQRRRLLEAKAQGWQSLRNEWVNVMQAPVVSRPSAWGNARPRPKRKEEAQQLADAARDVQIARGQRLKNQADLRGWRLLLRRLAKAVAFVSRVIAASRKRTADRGVKRRSTSYKSLVLKSRLRRTQNQSRCMPL